MTNNQIIKNMKNSKSEIRSSKQALNSKHEIQNSLGFSISDFEFICPPAKAIALAIAGRELRI
jgi:hypothetical protein